MHVNQAAFPTGVFTNSNNTANSLYAFIAGQTSGAPSTLIDDHWYTSAEPPVVTRLDANEGVVYWAKDGDTLARGFAKVAKFKDNKEWDLSGGMFGLTVRGLTWNLGSELLQSKLLIMLKTIGYNMKLVVSPEKVHRLRKVPNQTYSATVTRDYRPFQSVGDNMQKADAEQLLVQRGAAILVVRGDTMQWQNKRNGNGQQYGQWGNQFRQIQSTLSMATLSTMVPFVL